MQLIKERNIATKNYLLNNSELNKKTLRAPKVKLQTAKKEPRENVNTTSSTNATRNISRLTLKPKGQDLPTN